MTRRLALLVLLLSAVVLPSAGAQATTPVTVEARIAGREVATADSTDPVRIEPRREVPLELTIENQGEHRQEIRYVRLEGKALGLTFLTYDLGVRTALDPGERTTVTTALDFFDLDSQATGYLGTSLRVYDPQRRLLGEQSFVIDVRGKATSTLGLFAVGVVGIAGFSVAVLVLNTLRRRLPANRFVRGVQFAVAGSAVGLTLALGVSILRVAFADVEAWVPLVMFPTVVAFALGYVAPGPLSRSIRDVQADQALDRLARQALSRRAAPSAPSTGAFIPGSGFSPREPARETKVAASPQELSEKSSHRNG